MKLVQIVDRIVAINHAWKEARDEFGPSNPITSALRYQKSSWQATLIRHYPDHISIAVDVDNSSPDELLLSIRLKEPVNLNGIVKKDAEHLPYRIAEQILLKSELERFLK